MLCYRKAPAVAPSPHSLVRFSFAAKAKAAAKTTDDGEAAKKKKKPKAALAKVSKKKTDAAEGAAAPTARATKKSSHTDVPEGLQTVVLAEKPSVAADIARVLGPLSGGRFAKHTSGTFLLSSDQRTAVTWCFGHLVDWTDEQNLAASWKADALPILPEKFTLVPTTETSALRQLNSIKALFNSTSEIVVATDAGREGELIFRLIYEASNSSAPFKRLWVSSQTDDALLQGFKELKLGSAYDNLYRSAWCRKAADWIVGINGTKAFTIFHRGVPPFSWNSVVSVGRVQTPVLRMLVDRHLEIKAFKPTPYWEITLNCHLPGSPSSSFPLKWARSEAGAAATAALRDRVLSQEELQKVLANLAPPAAAPSSELPGTVDSFSEKKRTERPPKLFDLTELQKECNRSFGWSANYTLSTLQSLYEQHKLVTYPRTSSQYLTPDMLPLVKTVIEKVASAEEQAQLQANRLTASNAQVFDATKVKDHPALMPTGLAPSASLPAPQAKLYQLVRRRFLAAFMPDCIKAQTELLARFGTGHTPISSEDSGNAKTKKARGGQGAGAEAGESAGELFRGSVTRILVPGWRRIYGAEAAPDKGALPLVNLPELKAGAQLIATLPPGVAAKETKPPSYHTEASILHLMETAGKQLEDEDSREAMKDSGLGTAATRAAILERLVDVRYVSKIDGKLVPTEKGVALIRLVEKDPIASPELTGRWEHRLQRIEAGAKGESEDKFMSDIRDFTRELVAGVKRDAAVLRRTRSDEKAEKPEELGVCPVCSVGKVISSENSYRGNCGGAGKKCSFWVAKRFAGVEITPELLQELILNGSTRQIEGFVSKKTGRKFGAKLAIQSDGKVLFKFPERTAASGGKKPWGRKGAFVKQANSAAEEGIGEVGRDADGDH